LPVTEALQKYLDDSRVQRGTSGASQSTIDTCGARRIGLIGTGEGVATGVDLALEADDVVPFLVARVVGAGVGVGGEVITGPVIEAVLAGVLESPFVKGLCENKRKEEQSGHRRIIQSGGSVDAPTWR
jgi:hypothetical protein